MTRSARIISGVVTIACLGGCSIGPNYKRPPVAEPSAFRGQEIAEAASLADVPWWDVFEDPSLKALIQEARATLGVARSEFFPSLDYDVSASRSRVNPGVLGAPGGRAREASNFYSATMTMSWELDLWGRIRRLNESARGTLLATEDARRGVWLTLISDLAQAYFELLALDVRLQIARNSTD